jgi:undecaprenyl-diphosphatase
MDESPFVQVTLVAALILGIVEGLTEFLPVSSTGHLILVGEALGAHSKVLEIGIQFGAITAIVALYWSRICHAARTLLNNKKGAPNLLWLIALAAVPAVLLGAMLGGTIKHYLFNTPFVAFTTAVGGGLILWLEKHCQRRTAAPCEMESIGYRQALLIGAWQCLALLPGTSRSAATMAGGMLLGLSRATAAEFSFLLGLPILYGACAKEVAGNWREVTGPLFWPFLVGTLAAFLMALIVVRPFVRFLRGHTFVPFAIYRIVLGAIVGIYWLVAH